MATTGSHPASRLPGTYRALVSTLSTGRIQKSSAKSNQESQKFLLDIAPLSTTIWLWIDWIQHLRLCLIQPGGR